MDELFVAVAPELLDRLDTMVVVRSEDDTDETYQSRCELMAAIVEHVRRTKK